MPPPSAPPLAPPPCEPGSGEGSGDDLWVDPRCSGVYEPREPPPPASPGQIQLRTIEQTFILAGTVETFDRDGFRTNLATSLSVEPAAIALNVSAASVEVVSTITTTSQDVAAAVQTQMSSFSNNTALATSMLGVTVESASLPTVMIEFTGAASGCAASAALATAAAASTSAVTAARAVAARFWRGRGHRPRRARRRACGRRPRRLLSVARVPAQARQGLENEQIRSDRDEIGRAADERPLQAREHPAAL